MAKSYLAWPVQFLPSLKIPEAHITLKYFGDSMVSPLDLKKRFSDCMLRFRIKQTHWNSEIFGGLSYVMVLNNVDPGLFITRSVVEDLHQDDYPQWRPHITLSREVWLKISQDKLQPSDVITSVGALTLFVDKYPAWRFHA
jgi:hypothetical protein